MGSSESKPAGAQVWKASGPAGISQDLVDSLQTSHETDASRAKLLETQIQARVAAELKKIHQQETEALNLAHEKLSSAVSSNPAKSNAEAPDASRHSVSKEVEALRSKLEGRKALRDLPESVEGARSELVRCLRENDRRPLDCWEEVVRFKAEVKKLEKGWVDRVTS